MMKVIFPIAYETGTNIIKYPDTRSLFSNVKRVGGDITADYNGSLTTLTEYVPTPRPITDIALPLNGDRVMVGVALSFDFATELPDGDYEMPVRLYGTSMMKLFKVTVANGAGVLNCTFGVSGIYFIDRADLTSDLKVNGSLTERFTLYVRE